MVVQYVNDSLARVTGFKDIIAPNGRPNIGVCVAYDALKNLPECDPRYRVELPKKKRKGKKIAYAFFEVLSFVRVFAFCERLVLVSTTKLYC